MGSLMAGWDSPTKDPKHVKLMRNKSLTKEGIEEYWKLKKKTEDEHLKAVSPEVISIAEEYTYKKECRRTSSFPIIDTKRGQLKSSKKTDDVDLEELMKRNCWWTRSDWAFLNEPPVIESEVPKYKYASQHHVASLTSTKPDTRVTSI